MSVHGNNKNNGELLNLASAATTLPFTQKPINKFKHFAGTVLVRSFNLLVVLVLEYYLYIRYIYRYTGGGVRRTRYNFY